MKQRPLPKPPKNRMRALARVLSEDFHNHQKCMIRLLIDGAWQQFPILDWEEKEHYTLFKAGNTLKGCTVERFQFVDDENRILDDTTGPVEFASVSPLYYASFGDFQPTCKFASS